MKATFTLLFALALTAGVFVQTETAQITVSGSNTTATSGTLFFSTGTTLGNDGNTITNNNITTAGSNLPILVPLF
jgi:hypothetical protein